MRRFAEQHKAARLDRLKVGRNHPAWQLEPSCIDPSTGAPFRCPFCDAVLFTHEATSGRKTPCCDDGRLVRACIAVPEVSRAVRAVLLDPRWPQLCRAVNNACTLASRCVRRGTAAGGRGMHIRSGSAAGCRGPPGCIWLEGAVCFFEQTPGVSRAYAGRDAITTLTQASKQWWVFAAPLPDGVDDDVADLIGRMRAAIVRNHAACAEGIAVHRRLEAVAENAPHLRVSIRRRGATDEVHVAMNCASADGALLLPALIPSLAPSFKATVKACLFACR